jgi:hypothetical protein
LTVPVDIQAEKQGLRRLVFMGELLESINGGTPVLRAISRSGVLPMVLKVTSLSGSTPASLRRRRDKNDSPDVSEATPRTFPFISLTERISGLDMREKSGRLL